MIVSVKRVKLATLSDYQEQLLNNLQKYGILMLTANDPEEKKELFEDKWLERTEKSLSLIKEYQGKEDLLEQRQSIDYEEFMRFDENRKQILLEIETCNEEINILENKIELLQENIVFYKPWQALPIKISQLGKSKYSVSRIGYINSNRLKEFALFVNEQGAEYLLLEQNAEGQAVAVVCFYANEIEFFNNLKSFDFHEVNLPKDERQPAQLISDKEGEVSELKQKLQALKEKLKGYSTVINELQILSDQLESISQLKKAPITQLTRTIYLEGWVREDRVDVLKQAIDEVTNIYDLDISESEEETPPTVIENNKFVEPFETITEMFSLPDPGELDPNPTLSFWYTFLFGMMMGDVGYGFLITLFTFIFIKLNKSKGKDLRLIKVFSFGGIATILWGAIYGSYFGYSIKYSLLDPMSNPLQMLIVSLVVGVLHIITGLIVKASHNIRQKKYFSALFDQVSWMMILIGLGLFVIPSMSTIGGALAISGAALILVGGGRNNKGIFGKVFGGLGGLYNITSYLSDILSYSRILALALSTATIGWVMNMLANMFAGSFFGYIVAGIVLLIGHTFNIVMGILSAYVHDSRLQYIEFFNQFYQGGGYAFEPLSLKLKYIEKIKIANT